MSYRQSCVDTAQEAPPWEEFKRRAHPQRRGLLIETDGINVWLAPVRQRQRQQPRPVFGSDRVDGRWARCWPKRWKCAC